MNSDLSEIKDIVHCLEVENRTLVTENEKLKQCLAERGRKLKCEKEDKRKLENALQASEEANHQLEHINKELEAYVEEKETLVSRYEHEIECLKNNLKENNQENIELKRELDNCKQCLEMTHMELTSCKKRQSKTLKKLQMCVEQTEKVLASEKENVKRLQEELDGSEEFNRQLKMENVCLEDKIYDLQKTINKARDAYESTQQELISLKDDYDRYRKSIRKLKCR